MQDIMKSVSNNVYFRRVLFEKFNNNSSDS